MTIQTTLPVKSPYERIGGEAAVRRLVDRFYELMDTLPEAWEIRRMHAADLSGANGKLYKFLTGWLGGPPLYERENGHPMLRRRHLPFPIGTREAEQWMLCMRQALDEIVEDRMLREHLKMAFHGIAMHMRNQAEPAAAGDGLVQIQGAERR
ncbi:MAG: group II truncated hemoglobin [Chromatiales bacterium]|jgi:hemoglobin|nr:group II truncated hemoglobin [Chromatiales bacterium]